MKPKKLKERLALNKKTIANVTHGMMKDVLGGDTGYTRCIPENCSTQSNTDCCHVNISDEVSCVCPPVPIPSDGDEPAIVTG